MSSNSTSFISISTQKQWGLEIDNYLSKHHVVDIDSEYPTCVFRVPKNLIETKPEAYAPRHLGLGPYHHLRPEFYATQKHKISAVKEFLGKEKLEVFNEVVKTLIKSETVIRACYDQYLYFHIETLARILAIDGLYLLQFFKSRERDEKVVADILMLENQIPVVLLKIIRVVLMSNGICEPEMGKRALPREFPDFREPKSGEHALSREFQDFCQAHSPFKPECAISETGLHLLHLMYYLIWYTEFSMAVASTTSTEIYEFVENVSTCLEILGVPGAAILRQMSAIVERVKRIYARFKKEEIPSPVEGIDIPTVSEMTETAGIGFGLTIQGIRGIEYEGKGKIFRLPSIRLDANSEVILRNLVAFEAAAPPITTRTWSEHGLASYVDLMCGIIKTTKDVCILKTAKIIEGKLSDEEIIRVFDGLRKSRGENNKTPSYVQKAVDDVNKRYNDVRSVKVKRFVKKYLNASWKIISLAVAVVVVVLLALQALCSVFGCTRWFGKSNITVQGFHFLYGDQ